MNTKDFLFEFLLPLILAVFPLIIARVISARLYWLCLGFFVLIVSVCLYPKFKKFIRIQHTLRHEILSMFLMGVKAIIQKYSNVPVKICFFKIRKNKLANSELEFLLRKDFFVVGDFSSVDKSLGGLTLPYSNDFILTVEISGFVCLPVWAFKKDKKILVGGLYIYIEAPYKIKDTSLLDINLLSLLERVCKILPILM